jgi:SAM-dependent methyltransferase
MNCYLCNGTEFLVRKGVVREAPSLKILECTACGLVTLSSRDHIGAGFYEESGVHSGVVPTMEWWLNEAEVDDRRRFELLRPAMINRRVLDFGCGAAGFLRLAQTVTAHAAGVELERRVHDYYAGRLTLYPGLADAPDDYDLVTAFHVVEHLADPRGVLIELGRRIKPGGRIVIEVPSADDALLTLYDCDAYQRFSYWSQHLFLFGAASLKNLADQAGLAVVAIQHYQRYPLSNHLHWLSRGLAGGHQQWSFLDTPALTAAYAASLAAIGRTDTLIAYLERPA